MAKWHCYFAMHCKCHENVVVTRKGLAGKNKENGTQGSVLENIKKYTTTTAIKAVRFYFCFFIYLLEVVTMP